MTTFTDTFTTFVDTVAAHLDDHEVHGDGIAARMYLSRSQLDRVVCAAAGETPGRFRRRVLLERAAYRLANTATATDILRVAVEAGYSSHEAFTRAFSRAYGVVPSVWRSRPGRPQLPAPNGVHFYPPGGLRLPAAQKVTAMELLTKMVEHHIWLVGEMIERAGQLTNEQLDNPIEVSVDDDPQTVRSLLSRLVGQMDMWNCAVADRDYDWSVEEHEDLAAMRTRLAEAGPAFLSEVRQVVEEARLGETFVDALCEPAEVFTYGGMIAHVLTFAAHRRTLVALALNDAGIPDLGWGDPMRWVADPG